MGVGGCGWVWVRACMCVCELAPLSLPISSDEEGGPAIQVGFVTYDKVLHFYNVKVSTQCVHV